MHAKAAPELHAERRIDEPAGDHQGHVLLDRHPVFPQAVAPEQAARDVPPEIQASDERVAGSVEEPGDPSTAILGQDADVRAVEPVAVRVVVAEPVVIDRVDVAVLDVIEVGRRPEVRRAGDRPAGGGDGGELALRKALDVGPVVRGSDQLVSASVGNDAR